MQVSKFNLMPNSRPSARLPAACALGTLFLCGTLSAIGVACANRSSSNQRATHGASPTVSSIANPSPLASVTSIPTRLPLDGGSADANSTVSAKRRTCPDVPAVSEVATPCGDLHCLAFTSPAAAFAQVLSKKPRVIGIGESHAQKGSESVVPTPRRFAEQLLPSLCGHTHSMILEIWLPRNDCGDQRVKQVQRQQKPVTAAQSKSNQDDYVALGYAAKRLGIEPSALVPACNEYQSILDAGSDSIARMLALIGTKTAERVVEELHRVDDPEAVAPVVAYGGALHNDAEPTPDHLEFSYGPRLLSETGGRYVELDLVVREYVKDTEVWQKQPYYRALRKNPLPDKTLLYQWGEHSFALVLSD